MTNENTTTKAPAATLTEGQLFAEFYESDFIQYDTRGKEEHRHSVAALLEPYCYFMDVDFRIVPGREYMSEHLEDVESELLGVLANLRLARKAWADFRSERFIDDDGDVERYTVREGEAA